MAHTEGWFMQLNKEDLLSLIFDYQRKPFGKILDDLKMILLKWELDL